MKIYSKCCQAAVHSEGNRSRYRVRQECGQACDIITKIDSNGGSDGSSKKIEIMKSFIGIQTKEAVAKFYFNPGKDALNFCYGNCDINSVIPVFIIYKQILYVQDNFTDPNFELINYECMDLTSLNEGEYKAFCKYLLDQNIEYRRDFVKAQIKISESADHAVDAMAASLRNQFSEKESQAEKEIIDQLKIPALENSLNEALRIENYAAAAHIRKKVEASGHFIIEDDGWLKIRMKNNPKQLKGIDYNNVFYPGH